MDTLIHYGYFSTRYDLIKEAVKHYIHEVTTRELRRKIPQKEPTEDYINTELNELKRIRKYLWEKDDIH